MSKARTKTTTKANGKDARLFEAIKDFRAKCKADERAYLDFQRKAGQRDKIIQQWRKKEGIIPVRDRQPGPAETFYEISKLAIGMAKKYGDDAKALQRDANKICDKINAESEAERIRSCRQEQEITREASKKTGADVAFDVWNEAQRAREKAADRVSRLRAMTAAGIKAKLGIYHEIMEDGPDEWPLSARRGPEAWLKSIGADIDKIA